MSVSEAVDVPLCVNCESALLKVNINYEAIFQLIKKNILYALALPIWLLRGKSALMQHVSKVVRINWSIVPLCEPALEQMRAAHAEHRRVLLLTPMPNIWAQELADELGLAEVICIDENSRDASVENLKFRLAELFGEQGFDYIGDGRRDLPICKLARRVLIVTTNPAMIAWAKENASVVSVILRDGAGFFTFIKMIRVHQWVKNFLIWVPLLAAHRLSSLHDIGIGAIAFVAFSFCASSVYVLNDLLDLESDRQHVRKRNRPIASGKIAVNQALTIGLLLFITSVSVALQVSALFTMTLGIYFAMTLAYSLRLKRQVIVDVMLLAALYTIRVVAGAVATIVVPSFWLLALSMFLFLSLAVVKRYSEMLVTLSQDKQYAAGRGYSVADMPVLLSLGVGAGIAAIVVLALYINDSATIKLYPATIWLWPVPPLILYWVSRVWMKAHRGELHDDPVVFAMRDWQSLVTLVLVGTCFAAATIS
jgi:4-hydroxybenzoate polyprenyltransferase/phosphoserine phosphatase